MDVLLNNASPTTRRGTVLYNTLDFFEIFGYLDSMAAISVLTWLDNPNISGRQWRSVISGLFGFLVLLLIFTLLRAILRTLVIIVFALLRFLFSSFLLFGLHQSFFRFDVLLALVVELLEFLELWVREAGLDVESDWQIVKNVLLHGLIVVFHVQEQRLLVIQMEVILDLVVKPGFKELLSNLCLRLLILLILLLVTNGLILDFIQTRNTVLTMGLVTRM